jgi:AcrR family transcriptional regulator
VDEIASALGMTKSHLYYYFRNKEEILFVLHDWSVDLLLERLHRAEKSGGSATETLRQVVLGFVHMVIDELHGTALTLDLEPLGRRRLRQVISKRDRFDQGVRRIIRKGMASGEFAPGEAKLSAFAVLGAVNWISRWFSPRGRASSEEIGRAFASVLLEGLRARG